MTETCGYSLGEIPVASAFTSAFRIPADESLQTVLNILEQDRRNMDIQPGMHIKYVPLRFDPLTGHLLTGGAYLFSDPQTCAAYVDWTKKVYEGPMPGTRFWDRPIFQDVRYWTWDVIGAHNFTLPERHVLSRVQHFSYSGDAAATTKLLRRAYLKLRDAAKEHGATAFWLLHQPEEKLISTHFIADRTGGSDPLTATREAVARLEALASHGDHLPFSSTTIFDRTSLFFQQWLPVSRLAGGVPQATPNFPILPQVSAEQE